MPSSSRPWVRWRRLLLRLLVSICLQAKQLFMQLTRQPQLRQVRQLQKRREHLEQQALSLAQQGQKMMAEASSGSTMPAQGYLNVSRPEDRVRPMACIRGRGRYLVPELEKSPHCAHLKTTHGANRILSYQRCDQCGQEQQMPLTPLQDLQHWNDTLVYVKCAFFEKATERLEAKVAAKEKARGTSTKSSSTLQPTAKKASARAVGTSSMTGTSKITATKSRSRPVVKEETPDEWLVCKEEEQEMAAFEAFSLATRRWRLDPWILWFRLTLSIAACVVWAWPSCTSTHRVSVSTGNAIGTTVRFDGQIWMRPPRWQMRLPRWQWEFFYVPIVKRTRCFTWMCLPTARRTRRRSSAPTRSATWRCTCSSCHW